MSICSGSSQAPFPTYSHVIPGDCAHRVDTVIRANRRAAMEKQADWISDNIEVVPVVVLSQTFPARPSSIPDVRDFVKRCLAQSPLTEEDNREVGETVAHSLLKNQASDMKAAAAGRGGPAPMAGGDDTAFADWMGNVLRREGMTMEVAAKQLGVSVKTVSRWVGGATEPRLRDLRRIRELFGDFPLL